MSIKKEPITSYCQNCRQLIIVKFCPPRQQYVTKNNWGYWTEKEEYSDHYICSPCLKKLYYTDYFTFKEKVNNPKKRNILKVYLSLGLL